MKQLRKYVGRLASVLFALQLLLFLVSWLLAAVSPGTSVRSLLAGEGVRWFFGRFVDNLATPLLVWLLLAALAYGALRSSGLLPTLRQLLSGPRLPFRSRYGLTIVLVEVILVVVVMVLLTAIPHAVLLSATGHLFPSSFSRSLVPVVCFAVILVSVSFGLATGRFRSSDDVFNALSSGVASWLPLWLLYVLAVQFYCSVCYVFFG
ncbi:MAG: AbgT family transporter [Prevotella sp.]|nr:AbgT family transporter [Prevotella sp.]